VDVFSQTVADIIAIIQTVSDNIPAGPACWYMNMDDSSVLCMEVCKTSR